MEPILQIIVIAITIVTTTLAAYYSFQWKKLKSVVTGAHGCLEAVDKALIDDKVSEEEFRDIWNKCYNNLMKVVKE